MQVLHDNVLVTEMAVENKTTSGLILSAGITTGHKPAKIIAVGTDVDQVVAGQTVYLDWSKSMPVELDGTKCAVLKIEDVKLIIG